MQHNPECFIELDCALQAGAVRASGPHGGDERRGPLSRQRVRALWTRSGIDVADLTRDMLEALRERINDELRRDRPIKHFCVRSRPRLTDGPGNRRAYLRCSAHYFTDREAVTFHRDGFLGIAGWADDATVQPILRAFVSWLGSATSDETTSGRH